MTITEKIEKYNSEIKKLNESIISFEERIKIKKDMLEESKAKLLELTKTNSLEEAISYMKEVKELIVKNETALEKEIDDFLDKVK